MLRIFEMHTKIFWCFFFILFLSRLRMRWTMKTYWLYIVYGVKRTLYNACEMLKLKYRCVFSVLLLFYFGCVNVDALELLSRYCFVFSTILRNCVYVCVVYLAQNSAIVNSVWHISVVTKPIQQFDERWRFSQSKFKCLNSELGHFFFFENLKKKTFRSKRASFFFVMKKTESFYCRKTFNFWLSKNVERKKHRHKIIFRE